MSLACGDAARARCLYPVTSRSVGTKAAAYNKSDCPCADCGTPTCPRSAGPGMWEWYMVVPDVWFGADGPVWVDNDAETAFFLCIGCLEKRLGRQLTLPADFSEPPGLDLGPGWRTPRLLRRAGYHDIAAFVEVLPAAGMIMTAHDHPRCRG